MSPTTSKTTDEPKQSLPVGHPQAGYLPPPPAEGLGTGKLPDEEQERLDKAAADYETQAETIAENEDAVVKAEAEPEDEETPPTTPATKPAAEKTSS